MSLTSRQKHNLAKGAFGTVFTLLALWGLRALLGLAQDRWGSTGLTVAVVATIVVSLIGAVLLDRSDYGPGFSLRVYWQQGLGGTPVQRFWFFLSAVGLAAIFIAYAVTR